MTTPRKVPINTPNVGDRCRLRGRTQTGQIIKVNPDCEWARVKWDDGIKAPLIVHRHELELIPGT